MFSAMTDAILRLRNRHFLAIDIVLFLCTPVIALALRTDGSSLLAYRNSLLVVITVFLLAKLVVFLPLGLYDRYWRYASIDELAQIATGGLYVLGLELGLFFLVLRPQHLIAADFPRSIPLIDVLVTVPLVGLLRYSARLAERLRQRGNGHDDATRVLIVGAGEAGVMIAREMQSSAKSGLHPVGFVDDDPLKQNAIIRGIRVLGNRHEIPAIVADTKARQVIIAMPTAPGKVIREILAICEAARVQTRIMPGMYELLDGTVGVNQLRKVEIQDLLRREPVEIDIAAVRAQVRGKRVLVTGGGGSIGGELCRQVLRCEPSQLVVLGHGENSVFEITNELRRGAGTSVQIIPVIADIRFPERLKAVFQEQRPQIVLHAAAHKHVPLMEMNPAEAITNNVLGTRNLLAAAQAVNVERFVMISTDKAVNPTSIMGASKRAAELLVHRAAAQRGKAYVAVRFGNVLGSRGSVLLTFQQQIAGGGPLTVTHPDMKRYFMTIPEAVQLVLQAGTLGRGGEVFVLDMGDPVRIADLAHDVVELSGLQVGRDIDIVFTGVRPGEKLFEELFVDGEAYHPTGHDKILIASNASSFVPLDLDEAVGVLEAAARRNDRAAIVRGLQNLIPEFSPAAKPAADQNQAAGGDGPTRVMAPLTPQVWGEQVVGVRGPVE